ncbi:phage head morphogenesis protein, partial [Lactobacillus sp. XV13L]|nr:phage head morphogenesis protein [Lactobacillus sp. XV13L]
VINRQKMHDYQTRKVKQYKFLSLEAVTTCAECAALDGQVFNLEDAQEGINYPPMHIN